MSTEQSVDPHLIEQTKQQIRSLVVEIANLSKQDLDVREFYGAFLDRVISALAAIGGAVWAISEAGGLELQYQNNLRETHLADNQESLNAHGQLLQKIIASGEGGLVQPRSGEGQNGQASNPSDFLLILGPIKLDQDTKGIVEVFQRPGAPPTTQRGYLKFLLQMCDLASDFLKTRQLRHFTDRQALWNQLESFTRMAHTSLDPRETAYTIANEGRRLIECDRVSVAIRRGKKCTIEAVSGQDTFDKRSNTIMLLNHLATAVVSAGEPLWYSGDATNLAPQVEDAVQEYVDESHSKNVAVLPLKRPSDPSEEKEQTETIGALIVEQIEDARPREGMVQRVNVVCEHSSLAMANALEHNDLFLMPLWRTLGKATWIVSARTLPKTISIAVAVLVAIIGFIVVPVDFTLTGDGTLEPVLRRDVFAAVEGQVEQVLVEHGQQVKAGDVLLVLRNPDLDVAMSETSGKLQQAAKGMMAARRKVISLRGGKAEEEDERDQAQSEENQYRQQIESLTSQLQLLEDKKAKLKVTSPIDGEITTWDPEKELLTRPVKPGEVLLTVADPSGDWQLELQMAEDRMGHITKAQHELGEDLKVTYHLATEPSNNYEGKIEKIHEAAEVRGEEGNTVLVKVAIDKHMHEELLRPGANVKARVYCGRASVGYWLFHDAIDFVESRVLFPMNF